MRNLFVDVEIKGDGSGLSFANAFTYKDAKKIWKPEDRVWISTEAVAGLPAWLRDSPLMRMSPGHPDNLDLYIYETP